MAIELVCCTVGAILWLGCTSPALDDLVLRPSDEFVATPEVLGLAYDEVRIPVAGDRGISAWHVHSYDPRAMLVVVPGSDSNKSRYLAAIPTFVNFGFDVLLFDYEGFGDSAGTLDLAHVLDDTEAAIDYALSKSDHVFAMGVSLGAPAVAKVAAERELAGVIFEGTLVFEDVAELWLRDRGLPISGLWDFANLWMLPQVPEGYDILAMLPRVTEPKLFLHSRDDQITPFEGAIRAYNASPQPRQFVELEGDHGRMIELDPQRYLLILLEFVDSNMERIEGRIEVLQYATDGLARRTPVPASDESAPRATVSTGQSQR
jgi:hypothetical protein